MKTRAKQLLSLMISAAMVSGSPCLTAAADFSSAEAPAVSSDSSFDNSSTEDFSQDNNAEDAPASDNSEAPDADTDNIPETPSDPSISEIPEEAAGESDDLTLSDDASDSTEGVSEDEELFDDDQNPDFSDGAEEGQALAGEISENTSHTLSASAGNISNNCSNQHYSSYGSIVCSHLIADGNGYLRVEENDTHMLIQQYNSAFQLKSTRTINNELSYYGGFYAGANNYYVVYGQDNHEENKAKEVMRLVKYDKSWNRLGSVSLYGANTYYPFVSGSLRMYEYGNYLFIRTCHSMFKSEDGNHHQANLTWQVDTSSMSTVDSYSGIMNVGIGYVSHSFNQFILVDDAGNVVGLDHGDAYPRSAVLGRYRKKAGASGFLSGYDYTEVLRFQGQIGNNYTGASLGGLEYSDSSYLVAGNSVVQDSGWDNHNARNIFVATASRSDSSLSSSLNWITSYSESSGITASTPQLVKLGSNSFLLLWEQHANKGSWYTESNGRVSYVFLDGSGRRTSQIYTQNGNLSDCKPSVFNGTATWYVTDGSKLTFYQIGANGSWRSETGHMNTWTPELKFRNSTITAGLIEQTASNPLTAKTDGSITYTSSNPSVATVDQNGRLTFKGLGTCTITVNTTAGTNYTAGSASYTLNVINLQKQTLNIKNSFSCTYGAKSFSLNASAKTPITYTNKNTDIVSVSSSGVVTPKKAGTATIVVTAARTGSYISDSKTVTVVVNPKNISSCKMIFTKVGYVAFDFDEARKNLAIVDGETILKKDSDYYLGGGYMSGSTSGLWVSFYVEGDGNYTGSLSLSAATISDKGCLTSAASTSKGIKLTWQQESGLGYYIYRKVGNGKYSMVKKITNPSTTSWVDTATAKNRGFYTYAIKAYTKNTAGKTIATQLSSAKTAGIAPIMLSASRRGKTVRVTYKKSAGTSGYTIYRLQGKKWKAVGSTRSTVFTDKKPGSARKYRIRAYRTVKGKKIYGPYSSIKSVK